MATSAAAIRKPEAREFSFTWVGQDRGGKTVRGEIRASGEAQASVMLRRQGIKVQELKKQKRGRGGKQQGRRAGARSHGTNVGCPPRGD